MSLQKEKEQISPPSNIGISMMLVVFLVLCLFTFSAIALVQAENEYKNAVTMSDIRSSYYEGVTACQNDLHKLNLTVREDATDAKPTITKTYPLNEDMVLSATFSLITQESGGHYQITDFRTLSTGEWSGDNKLNLLK